ncbi:MAG: phage tail tape measure C-terminal domain-containing protein, partial [Methanoregulaceae archaeon]|nr:phage tail tape measure C-terminal domain-containing protein [Methanoregulaceae archaeon]
VTLDVATALKTDLKSAALQVGKALNDPVLGMTALSRSGIQFSEAQKEVVKELVKTGDTVGAQKIILKELETQFGGSAEAARNTLGGALASLKNAFGDLLEGDGKGGGVKGTTAAIEDLTKLMSDPSTVANAQTLTNAMITGFGKVLKAISTTVEFTKWLGEELAAQIYGVAGGDINRLEGSLDTAKKKLQELEDGYKAVGFADKLLGKIGISEGILEKLRGIKSAREEVKKLQKQVDDYYAFEDAKKKGSAKTPDVPDVPVVTSGGVVEETPEAIAAREKAAKRAEEIHQLTVDNYLKTESEKWAALEEYEKDYADKQTEFSDAHKKATLSDVDYELAKLQEQYDAYSVYITDKVALDEWYAASKKKILDKEKDDETGMLKELKTAIDGWGRDSTDAIVAFARTGEMSFSDMVDSMIDDLMRMFIQQQIMGPLFSSIGGFDFGSLFGSAKGNAFQNGNVIPFASGGIVTRPTVFPMAQGAGLMGEAGAEAIMPLTRIGGDLGVKATGGGGMVVNIFNSTGDSVETKEGMTADGSPTLDVMIDQAVAKKLGRFGSQSNKSLRQNFGASQRLTGR